ncbi:MAG TPA: tetratricopeptide repeat protein [Tepidisphaeraceae bacterium]|jgi:tetratricopeptide (TPR) repeat protein|nr:tetratricopeptide repeat protein [Tepidisphaeraceae bacterium]
MDTAQLLTNALAHHQAGQLPQAEALYRQILTADPNQPDALHLLGVIAHQVGQQPAAIDLIQRALAVNPNNASFYNNLGEALRAVGRIQDAANAYQRAIQLDPNQADAFSNLSLVLRAHGQITQAAEAARRAVAIRPDFANGHLNLGTALVDSDPEAAFQALSRAAQLNPNLAAAHCNLGLLLTRVNRHAEAIECCNRALAIEPRFLEALVNLSLAAINSERLDLANDAARRAIAVDPNSPMAYTNLGLACSQSLRHEDTIDALKRAIELDPNNSVFHKNLGVGFVKIGRLHEAIASFERSIQLAPDYAEGHFNYAMALLTIGDFDRGWTEYEWRWKFEQFLSANPRNLPSPWDGQKDLAGKTVVIAYEQGFGDSIQFIRYASILADRGATVALFCPEILHPLLRTVPGVASCHAPNTPPPPCDFQINMLSLPRVFHTTTDTVPATTPYLTPDPEKVAAWRTKMDTAKPTPSGVGSDPNIKSLNVGLCWTGNHKHFNDRLRSVPAHLLAPLATIPSITFYSLQKRPADAPPVTQPPFPIIDLTNDIHDFSDTAALVANLDLVITVDTAAAHLAGALGKPVWTLIPIGPDFRWLLNRNDSPWYPTMTLYRQSTPNDWPSVLQRILTDLTQFAAQHTS